MKAYLKCGCTSRERLLAKRLKAEGHEVIILRHHPELRSFVKPYKSKLPFIFDGEKVIQL